MQKTLPVTTTLRAVIELANTELQRKQSEMSQIVMQASLEQMRFLGISIEDGWRLDYENMQYVKLEEPLEQKVVDSE